MIRVKVTLRVRTSKFCWVNIEACNLSGHFILNPSQCSTNVGVVTGEKTWVSHVCCSSLHYLMRRGGGNGVDIWAIHHCRWAKSRLGVVKTGRKMNTRKIKRKRLCLFSVFVGISQSKAELWGTFQLGFRHVQQSCVFYFSSCVC